MREIQKFALTNIYCSPRQDFQLRHDLARVTEQGKGDKNSVLLFGKTLPLPNKLSRFHVYTVGRAISQNLNLLRKPRNWETSSWIKASDDMNARPIIIQLYDERGVTYPRDKIYYLSDWEGGVVIAIEADSEFNRFFTIGETVSLRVYSNHYFSSPEFNSSPNRIAIRTEAIAALSNNDKVTLQRNANLLLANGGGIMTYVNGFYAGNVSLEIPDNSYIEYVYDASIVLKESVRIGSLRTFLSEKDNVMKYIVFRNGENVDELTYEDDLEIYITMESAVKVKGLYYFQHMEKALTNINDKDFAFHAQMVNNQAQMLVDMEGGSVANKRITIISRRTGYNRPLVYNSMKLHELYALPDNKEYEVMTNTGFTIDEFRVEALENSDYFKVASAKKITDVTPELAASAVGYNGVAYYYAKNPVKANQNGAVEVPYLFRQPSTAYGYDASGKLNEISDTTGPIFVVNSGTTLVEFIQGNATNRPEVLYETNSPISVRNTEFRVLRAFYEGPNRISTWEDVTDSPDCSYNDDIVIVGGSTSERVRIFYFDAPHMETFAADMQSGVIYFELKVWEDRGLGYAAYPIDYYYDSVEVFLNNHRLVYGVDWNMDYPRICVFNKTHLKYSEDNIIHVRCTGFNLDKEKINAKEINGFVSHGVLTRNKKYDIRKDRVWSAYIDGKLVDETTIRYSEDDNVIRLADPTNGKPYCLSERVVSIKEVTGLSSLPCYEKNDAVNKRIAALYDEIHPEQHIDPLNIISSHHYLFSPLISRMIHDLKTGVISTSIYMNPYNDFTITELIDRRYRDMFKLDPIKLDLPDNIVEIHPHYGNDVIDVTLHQFRFLSNVVRIITGGNSERINLSGYLTVTTETLDIEAPVVTEGIVVI